MRYSKWTPKHIAMGVVQEISRLRRRMPSDGGTELVGKRSHGVNGDCAGVDRVCRGGGAQDQACKFWRERIAPDSVIDSSRQAAIGANCGTFRLAVE